MNLILFLTFAGVLGAQQGMVDLALVDVDVFDARSGSVQADRTLLIDGDRIQAIQPKDEPVRARTTIEGRGRLVTPGLIDTHAHLLLILGDGGWGPARLREDDRELLARLYLQHGVTTLADMGQPEGWMETMLRWQEAPSADAPDLVVVGGSLCSQLSWDKRPPEHHTILATPELAREKVAQYAGMGARLLKLYWKLQRPEMEACIDEADARGLGMLAHVDNGIMTIQDTLELGVRHFEHFFTLASSCLDGREHEAAAAYGLGRRYSNLDEWTARLSFYFDHIAATPELSEKLTGLLERMAERGATLSTALNIMAAAVERTPTFSAFEPLPRRSAPLHEFDEERSAAVDAAFDTVLATVKAAHDAGVTLRIGTDANNGGEALLAELSLLVEAGLTPAEVLTVATLNGARALELPRHGVIEPGAVADLVLFEASPLEDIRNAGGAKTVIKSGRVFEPRPPLVDVLRTRLDAEGAEGAAKWIAGEQAAGRCGPAHAVELWELVQELLAEGRVPAARVALELGGERLDPRAEGYTYVAEAPLNDLGYVLLRDGRLEPAVELFELIVELFPASANAYDSLGESLLASGDEERAIANYRRSLELNPRNTGAAKVLRKLGVEVR